MPDLNRREFLARTGALAAAAALPSVPVATAVTKVDPLADIPHEVYSFASDEVARVFVCKWEDRYRLAGAVLGFKGCENLGLVRVASPDEHPRKPGWFASDVYFEPFGAYHADTIEVRHDGTLTARCRVVQAAVTVTYAKPEHIPGKGA